MRVKGLQRATAGSLRFDVDDRTAADCLDRVGSGPRCCWPLIAEAMEGGRTPRMIPRSREYLSLLMGAPSLSEAALRGAGVEVIERFGENLLGLLIPKNSLAAYKELVRDRLQPGFWNDLVSPEEIIFVFKLRDGTIREYVLDDENRAEISALCSEFNGDSIEKTSDIPNYFAANSFYHDVMVAYYGAEP